MSGLLFRVKVTDLGLRDFGIWGSGFWDSGFRVWGMWPLGLGGGGVAVTFRRFQHPNSINKSSDG